MLSQLKKDLGKKSVPSWAITNTVCCIPLDEDDETRVPSLEEMQSCSPRLLDFIFLCQPKLVVLLGEIAKRAWKKLGLKKYAFDFTDQTPIPSLELRHPVYLLRNGASEKRLFSENYNACLDYKRDYLKLRDEAKRLAKTR
jgi:uracil-DNA glycosylase family 4